MMDHNTESGLELVLDNRRLIIAFVVLIAFCGSFFVLGFIEGKRQGIREEAMTSTAAAETVSSDLQRKPSGSDEAASESALLRDDTESQPLNWYKNVNERSESAAVSPPAAESGSARKKTASPAPAKASAGSKKAPALSSLANPVTYTVQVGAFIHKKEAEIKAQMLRDKGFDCRIEPPVPPKEFHLIKVGKFDTRADAVAMQLRLKNSGFSCFIKAE
jgi:cell division protein FtsN